MVLKAYFQLNFNLNIFFLTENAEDMAEWERRLVEGDLPEDFLEVTEPSAQPKKNQPEHDKEDAATGLLVDIPTVTASNSVPQAQVPPTKSLQGITKIPL